MKHIYFGKQSGFSVIEILMVMVIIGALASIAIPQYASYQEDARSVSCEANRRHIEMDESNYYLDNDTPGLNIDGRYSCPSGGTYVWLKSDPNDPEYPQIGCSLHFAGTSSPDDTIEEEPEDEKTVSEMIDELIQIVNNADIKKTSVKNALVKKLNDAIKNLGGNKSDKAINNLNSFIDKVKKEEGKNIDADDASLLISKAEAIISMV
ncbi:prepilin-type N-terminal cleavage/methylation domain-containing protein [Thermodesulfobacteriota bacterium]